MTRHTRPGAVIFTGDKEYSSLPEVTNLNRTLWNGTMKSKESALRMHNVGIVVEDLKAVIAFFVELGLELEGQMTVEGKWVDRIVGLDGVRNDIAMMRTPDGHSRLELIKFRRPTAISAEAKNAPVNTLGIRRIMFA